METDACFIAKHTRQNLNKPWERHCRIHCMCNNNLPRLPWSSQALGWRRGVLWWCQLCSQSAGSYYYTCHTSCSTNEPAANSKHHNGDWLKKSNKQGCPIILQPRECKLSQSAGHLHHVMKVLESGYGSEKLVHEQKASLCPPPRNVKCNNQTQNSSDKTPFLPRWWWQRSSNTVQCLRCWGGNLAIKSFPTQSGRWALTQSEESPLLKALGNTAVMGAALGFAQRGRSCTTLNNMWLNHWRSFSEDLKKVCE